MGHSAFLLAFGHADQPGHLLHASVLVQAAHRCSGTSLQDLLLDQVLRVGHGGDLRKVRDAKHPLLTADGSHLFRHGLGHVAADAGVGLVEDHAGNAVMFRAGRLHCQHQA